MKKGAVFTEEHRKKLSEAAKRRKTHPMLGKHHSASTRKKIGLANMGRDTAKNLGSYAQEGSIPWNKGMKYTEELKSKLRQPDNTGRIFSNETKNKIKNKLTGNTNGRGKKGGTSTYKGDRHWNWKGGITPQKILDRGKFLRRIQPEVLARDNYTCQICDEYGSYLHVDHIKSWAKYPELRFEIDNCRTLCRPCHYYITFKRKMPIGSLWGLNSPLDKKAG